MSTIKIETPNITNQHQRQFYLTGQKRRQKKAKTEKVHNERRTIKEETESEVCIQE